MPLEKQNLTRFSLWVFVVALVFAGAAGPTGGILTNPPTAGSVGQIDLDTVSLVATLHTDGDASWAVHYRVRLDDDNESAAFDTLAQEISENRSAYTSRFERRMQRTVRVAENSTGREMGIRNVTVETERQEIPQQYGLLIYRFDWQNFATVYGNRIEAGDAIARLYLDESTSLTLTWPEGYNVTAVDPPPDDTSAQLATWQGPQDFTTDQPRIVLLNGSAPMDGSDGGDPRGTSEGLSLLPLVLVGFGVIVAVVGVGRWWQTRHSEGLTLADESTERDPKDELLSNEERVLRLLEAHGGRMKQQQVAEELGWTEAKTSQVVRQLREAGTIEGFRLGRENVLDLPSYEDEDPPL